MGWPSHCDLSSDNAQYSYCANGPAAVFFSVLFGLTWIAHLVQAIVYRKKFCWVIVVGTVWECLGLIMRTYSTINQTESTTASAGQLLVLLAPLWINAYIYMIFGRMVYYFLPEKKVAGIRAEKLAKIFIWLDVSSFIVQATGGIMDSDFSNEMDKIGLHVYTAGIAVQQFFIVCFIGLLIAFHRRMRQGHGRQDMMGDRQRWQALVFAMYASLSCITIRIIYRLAEFADTNTAGSSPLTVNEAPFYCLECLPMFAAMVIWNVWHPGRYLQGDESEFPKKIKLSRVEKRRRKLKAKEEAKERKRSNRRRSSSRKRNHRVSEYHLTEQSDNAQLEEGFTHAYPDRVRM
ncbi:RTA1 domain-containing protein [Aspergillus fijiensis CBS 313.89]|uniref:RTA1 domain protein n=1 Tax=Aspergillus fijiensis CBS 313.89 TaxID=1448319 RepID=A0A8G1RD08_9EURO|nr:uncharacterized protein BO72DRAFT_453666 [Aspergillus fijiensis CBS 313.89]RAK71482.1 hypothetical protein BO72DRAFT_453666 [Aspergillus fijiensis CBS 313.89]